MKILVCGGTGFVGSAIVQALLDRQKSVRVLARHPCYVPGVEFIQGDIFHPQTLQVAMQGCSTVIQAVQFKNAPFENPSKGLTYEKIDAQGTEAVVEQARVCGVRHMIYVSGAGTGGDKREPWFRAKWRAEQSVRNSGMKWTIFRPSWLYGPHDKTMNRLVRLIRWFPIIGVLGKGYKIQPVFIEDFAKIVALSVDEPRVLDQLYEIGGPMSLTMKEILQTVAHVLGKTRLYFSIPKRVAGLLFFCLEKIPGKFVTKEALDFLTMDVFISNESRERVKNDFQIQFKSLTEGLQTYLERNLKN